VRSGFALNPTTRTLQTEVDIPNSDGHIHPGWYATVTITVDRKQVWTLPSNAIDFRGQQNYFAYFDVDGKPIRTQVIIGASDDTHTEILRKFVPHSNTNAWPTFDGTERILVGNLDALAAAAVEASSPPPGPSASRPGNRSEFNARALDNSALRSEAPRTIGAGKERRALPSRSYKRPLQSASVTSNG
jgi:hypothetical protein